MGVGPASSGVRGEATKRFTLEEIYSPHGAVAVSVAMQDLDPVPPSIYYDPRLVVDERLHHLLDTRRGKLLRRIEKRK